MLTVHFSAPRFISTMPATLTLCQSLALVRTASPAVLMLLGMAACALAAALAVWAAVDQPWLGMGLRADASSGAVILQGVAHRGPAALVAARGRLTAIGGVAPKADDLAEEPDTLATYSAIDRFMARQETMARGMRAGPVAFAIDGRRVEVTAAPRRPLSDLPPVFWLQLAFGAGAALIGCWVWSLRPSDLGARLFAASGAGLVVAFYPAAVYSTRELALDAPLFRLLSALNHAGSLGFGVAMIALFLVYPRRIAPAWALWGSLAFFGAWLAADTAHAALDPAIGMYGAVSVEMACIVAAIFAQWRATRTDPAARAALRWFGVSVIVGTGAFIVLAAAPQLTDTAPVIPQAYTFGFFLLIYIGLALGLRRYRLFQLDEWAFRVLFFTGAAVALIALDAALILALRLGRGLSLGVALLGVAFLYLPFRDLLWRRLVMRRQMPEHELFRAVVDVAFGGAPAERTERWRELLQRLFDPLEIAPAERPAAAPAAGPDGLTMTFPPTAGAPSLTLRYPWGGKSLFGPSHLQFARQLSALMDHAEASRTAYEQGASAERKRIAQDLHDDVGARLLSGLHKPDVGQARLVLREAIADIRGIVSGLTGEALPLERVLADLRHETAQRLEAAGLAFGWDAPEDGEGRRLPYRIYKNYASAHRELVSNVIRHAGASRVEVTVRCTPDALETEVSDNGVGDLPESPAGSGLRNIRRRLGEIGGEVAFRDGKPGLTVSLRIPLSPSEVPA